LICGSLTIFIGIRFFTVVEGFTLVGWQQAGGWPVNSNLAILPLNFLLKLTLFAQVEKIHFMNNHASVTIQSRTFAYVCL
jgi:hypothetical protein